jgi:hypothetical protein
LQIRHLALFWPFFSPILVVVLVVGVVGGCCPASGRDGRVASSPIPVEFTHEPIDATNKYIREISVEGKTILKKEET